jgi:hypothetical protein
VVSPGLGIDDESIMLLEARYFAERHFIAKPLLTLEALPFANGTSRD